MTLSSTRPRAAARLPNGAERAPAAKRAPRAAQPPPPPAEEPARSTLTPGRWIDAATQVLVDQGIDHVRVDVLARELGVTRGSFYWHFKDREDLLRHVLQAWRARATEQVTARFDSRQADPHATMRELMTLPFRGRSAARAARIELAIRAWARRDAMARQAVDEADAARIEHQVDMFVQLGFAAADARTRAFVMYAWQVAESLLYRQGTAAQRDARRKAVEKLMLQPVR